MATTDQRRDADLASDADRASDAAQRDAAQRRDAAERRDAADGQWRDEERLPLEELNRAMATYSADGQVDDVTGQDAGAEQEFGHDYAPRGEENRFRPSPEGRTGPH